LELDTVILEYSLSVASRGLPTRVRSESDVDVLMAGLAEFLKGRKMWQYYVLDVLQEKEAVESAIKNDKVVPWSGPDVTGKSVAAVAEIVRTSSIIIGLNQLSSRYSARSDGEKAAGLIKAAFVNIGDDVDALVEAWGGIVDAINVPLYEEWEKDTKIALDQIKGRLKYIRLEESGPKLGEISAR
jgi:glycogen debranching enzyme